MSFDQYYYHPGTLLSVCSRCFLLKDHTASGFTWMTKLCVLDEGVPLVLLSSNIVCSDDWNSAELDRGVYVFSPLGVGLVDTNSVMVL